MIMFRIKSLVLIRKVPEYEGRDSQAEDALNYARIAQFEMRGARTASDWTKFIEAPPVVHGHPLSYSATYLRDAGEKVARVAHRWRDEGGRAHPWAVLIASRHDDQFFHEKVVCLFNSETDRDEFISMCSVMPESINDAV